MISKRGATSVTATIFIQDTSSGTGAGLTGLTASSGGLVAAYRGQGHAGGFTTFALSAGTLGTWSSGGFVEIDATHAAGLYEIGLPNAALAAGNFVDLYLAGAANMAPTPLKIDLVAYDPQDGQRLGMPSLPAANAGANGGLPIGDANGNVTIAGYAAGEDPATLVWNALKASFNTANTFGAYLQSISTGLTLDSGIAGHTTANTVGAVLNLLVGLSIDGAGKVTYNNAAPPSAGTIATAAAAAILANPTHLLVTDSSGDVTYNNAAPPTAAAISAVVTPAATAAIVDAILANPAYPIVTNASGQITYSNAAPPTLSAIETGVAGVILKTPSQPIATDAAGDVSLSSATITALLNGITTDAIAGGVLDQTNGIEVGLTVRQALRLIAAANLGTLIGAGTGTIAIDGAGIETTRITATVDVNGNRSVVTLAPGA